MKKNKLEIIIENPTDARASGGHVIGTRVRKNRLLPGVLLALALGSVFVVSTGWGEEKVPREAPEIRVDKMGTKCFRGVTNMATGWGELPRQFVRSAETDNPYLVFPLGLTRGLCMTVVRTVSGVIETAFFYVPFDGHYSPLLQPEYVWDAEDPRAEENGK